MGEPIRWGVVGWGTVGPAHAAALRDSPHASLVGVADLDDEALRRASAEHLPVYRTLDDLVDRGGAQAVVVAVPHHLHAPVVEAAARRGVHALVEKPMGRTVDECEKMIRAASDGDIALGGVLNMRGYRHLRWVRSTIASGFAVRSVSVDASLGRIGHPGGWARDPARAGGGVLLTAGIHYLDLLAWWLGPVRQVVGYVDSSGVETSATGMLNWESGSSATVRITAVARLSRPVRIVLEGDHGGIVVEGWQVIHTWGIEGPTAPPEAEDPALPYGPGHVTVVREAASALAEEGRFPIDGDEAARAVEIVEALYRSGRNRQWEEVGVFTGSPVVDPPA